MTAAGTNRILTVNSGSSSLKVALYEINGRESLVFDVSVTRIGDPVSHIGIIDGASRETVRSQGSFPAPGDALRAVLQLLQERQLDSQLDAVCHRIVQGGARHNAPRILTPQLIGELRTLIPIDPDHLPHALGDIEMVARRYPAVPQVACFDTAFHRTIPRVAKLLPIPRRYFDQGIRRYGFHGISYEYIVSELRALEPDLAGGRLVVAHLGNGASMAAIKGGCSLDSTMGFTPASGLLMGTRTGDMDPGVLLYLLTRENMSVEDLALLVNKHAGLLGLSGVSADMQDLLAREGADSNAADAVALFCYRAKQYLAAYAAVLGGLDLLIFTAGIGEHAPAIRERICLGLELLGIRLDPVRNQSNAPVISSQDSRVKVRVMKTNENLMLARHAASLLGGTQIP
jgi:acetate kinase